MASSLLLIPNILACIYFCDLWEIVLPPKSDNLCLKGKDHMLYRETVPSAGTVKQKDTFDSEVL